MKIKSTLFALLITLMTVTQVVTAAPLFVEQRHGSPARLNPSVLTSGTISFEMPSGQLIIAVAQTKKVDNDRGIRTWTGEIVGQPGSLLTLASYKGTVTGTLVTEDGVWDISPKGTLHEIVPAELDTIVSEPVKDTATFAESVVTSTGPVVIDVLIGYTVATVTKYGESGIRSRITSAVAAVNQSYVNSNLPITLRVVGLQLFSGYVEDGKQQNALNAVRSKTDGKIDYVHGIRDSVGADLVVFVTMDGGSCGIAGVMTTVSVQSEYLGFSVVRPSCFANLTLPHEIGHNMGNKHDRANATSQGAYPYSYGFRRCTSDGTGFRTIMSYSCTGAKRKAYFSSPNLTYMGFPMGIDYDSSPLTSADNVRSMRNTMATVAAFRPTVVK